MIDPEIEKLNLIEPAKSGAYLLKSKHPDTIFTSGRRDRYSQAHAMASNVVRNRLWISQTYIDTPISRALQAWINLNASAVSIDDITEGLLDVMTSFTDDELTVLSKHFSGLAWDVKPVVEDSVVIIADIRALPYLQKFLDHEGGLCRWHAQFFSVPGYGTGNSGQAE